MAAAVSSHPETDALMGNETPTRQRGTPQRVLADEPSR
jgi:hypothetical protein